MDDKQYREQKTRVKKCLDKWINLLLLHQYKIRVEYERFDFFEEDTKKDGLVFDKGVAASCAPDSNYLFANIVFYLRVIKDLEDIEVEECVVHELMHIYLSPMSTKEKSKEEELTATNLSRTLIKIQHQYDKTLEKKRKAGRKRLSGENPTRKRKPKV